MNNQTRVRTLSVQHIMSVVLSIIVLFALAMPVSVSAQMTSAQFQAEITRLTALIEQLTQQLGGGSTASVCPYTWTRSLSAGTTGADVQKLQQFLNADSATQVAVSGAGSAGNETMFFGPATAAAVSKFQSKYRSEILAPTGLVNPTGFFGPSTMAKANALCVRTTTPVVEKPTDTKTPPTEAPKNEKVVLRGEGILKTFEVDQASDTDVQENEKDAAIAELTVEAKNGDIELNRMDIALVGVNSPTENDPWDVFEDVAIWVDGKLVKRVDADNKSDYLDKNDGTIRFSKLDIILKNGKDVDITITASIQNGVDDAGTDADWSVSVEGVRYFDGEGVATEERSFDEIGDAVEFSIVEEGDGEELSFALASSNPGSTDIVVESNKITKNETILVYTIEAKNNDIELNNLFVNVVTSATTSDVVHDIELQVDGRLFRDESKVVNSALSTTYEFDIDGDVTVDEDEKITVKVIVALKAQDGRYDNGTTILAQVTSTERDATDAEGADDIDDFSGSAVGKTHTLVAEGIVIQNGSFKSVTDTLGTNNTIGEFELEFKIKAIEDDFYITEDTSRDAVLANTGVVYQISGPAGFIIGSSTVSAVFTSTAKENTSGVFTVREGTTETFTLLVTVDPNVAGQYRVGLVEVHFDDDSSGALSTEEYTPVPVQDFRSTYKFINN